MLEKIYLFFTPQFPPDGWENSQSGYTYNLQDEKTEKKKRKTKQGKQAILELL